jgi:hypothetical protein
MRVCQKKADACSKKEIAAATKHRGVGEVEVVVVEERIGGQTKTVSIYKHSIISSRVVAVVGGVGVVRVGVVGEERRVVVEVVEVGVVGEERRVVVEVGVVGEERRVVVGIVEVGVVGEDRRVEVKVVQVGVGVVGEEMRVVVEVVEVIGGGGEETRVVVEVVSSIRSVHIHIKHD